MDKIEKMILNTIDQHRQEIIDAGRYIWNYAELGYKEKKTSAYFAEKITPYCATVEIGHAITGVKGYLKEKNGPTICLMGELDGLPIPNHFAANRETGAAHCCGHNAQIAGVIGAALALSQPLIKERLDGNVVFFAVPAEEYVELEFKNHLMKEGKIKYGGGKCELIRIGAMDDIDVVVGHHILPGCGIRISNEKFNGFVCKTVRYMGISAHAAEYPEKGVDALAAANLAMHAIDVQRESFRDEDSVRVHGFISKGGEAMNVIADNVTMEYSVRANHISAICDAGRKFDRAIQAGAVATGCYVECITTPGYMPLVPVKEPFPMKEAIETVGETYSYPLELDYNSPIITSSTDYGDVSNLMPVLQFNTGGYEGKLHNADITVKDEELAYIITAKVFAVCAYRLLKDNAHAARKILSEFEPVFTKEEYCKYMDSMMKTVKTDMKPLL